MSFIHLSTIQPTDGQEEVTNRQPAFIKNDFRNGILLKKGETVELVALRLAFTQIPIVEGQNDTLYFMLGDGPNFCQLEAKLKPGTYTEVELASVLETAMNTAMNLPSFTVQKSYDPSTTPNVLSNGGIEVAYLASSTLPPGTQARYSISFNQLENDVVGQQTFSRMAIDANDDEWAMRVPRSGLNDNNNLGLYNGGNSGDTEDVWAVNTLYGHTDAYWSKNDLLDSAGEIRQYNVGQDSPGEKLGAICVAQGEPATNEFPEDTQSIEQPYFMNGVLDTEGKICAGTSPALGYGTTTLMSSFGTTGTSAGPVQVMIEELGRNSRTGAFNTSQAIYVPPQFQGHDVTIIELHLNNASGSVMNVVLDLYDSITDPTSTNVATRFAGLTPFSTTPASSVPATGATGHIDFDVDADTSIHNTFYIVLREASGGSTSGLSIQGSFGVDLGGTNGNMLAGLKHKVKGQSPGTAGSAVADREWTLMYNQDSDEVDGDVTVLAGDATSNYWNFQFDFPSASNAPIDANDGTGRTITRLYGVFSPNTAYLGIVEAGGLFWGVGTGADGTGGPPADARDPANWEYNIINKGASGFDTSTFYYCNDVDAGNVNFPRKAFYASTLLESGPTAVTDYYRVAWDTEDIEDTDSNSYTPSFYRTDLADVNLTADKRLGYNPLRVGLNRRVREVKDNYQQLNDEDPVAVPARGQQGIPVDNYRLCDYWIQCRNNKTDGTFKIDATSGALVPVIQVCVLERLEDKPLYPEAGNIEPQVVYEDYADVSLGPGYNADEDLVLQCRVENFNVIHFEIGSKPQQDPRRANVIAPRGINQTNMVNIYTTTNTGITATTQIKQSDYPLMASVSASRGAHYMVLNTVDQASVNDLASYVWVDGMLSMPDINELWNNNFSGDLNFQRQCREIFPKNSFGSAIPISAKRYSLTSMFKFGRLKLSDESFRAPADASPLLPSYYKNKQTDLVLSEYINSNNLANIDRIFGFKNLLNNPTPGPIGDGTAQREINGTEKIRTHPLTDVFHVELLSEPVKSHNGARGDIGKSIYTVSAEEVEIDTATRILSFTPKNRLPVDLNLVQDKTVYSMTVAIKDVNNKLVEGLEPPSDVTLYKTLPEGTRIQRALEDLKDVIGGKTSDTSNIKISNMGNDNPLLGVIPK